MMRLAALPFFLVVCNGFAQNNEPVVGLPCEGCEAVFEGMPERLAARARIGSVNEPGEPMVASGVVYDVAGKPRANIIVYAYQTNAQGIYPTSDKLRGMASHRHGTLRGWARTDENGRYTFDTVRPAGYPGTRLPEHIHLHIIEPGCATYYIDDIMFTDDPKLTPAQRRQLTADRAGNGVSTPEIREGVWFVTRDIQLGQNIPGYPSCESGKP